MANDQENDQGVVIEPVPPSDLEEVRKFWKRLGYTVTVESVNENFRVRAKKPKKKNPPQ
jgi:hypothetical protein